MLDTKALYSSGKIKGSCWLFNSARIDILVGLLPFLSQFDPSKKWDLSMTTKSGKLIRKEGREREGGERDER